MSCEQKKRRKLPELLKKTVFCLKNPHEKPVFLRFFGHSSSVRPEFQKLVGQKLFAIKKGNFSALDVKVKRIREKPKNDPP
jgi:hypothetical protein